jgi:tRNA-binding EMAP/Myf-like protein
MHYVSYEDFTSMDMRLGLIKFVEPVEGTDKLLRFEIDFGPLTKQRIQCNGTCTKNNQDDCEDCNEDASCSIHCECEPRGDDEPPFGKEAYTGRDVRQIVSGVREFFPDYETLVGTYGLYILNLKPREIRGVMSNGMLMAVDGVDGNPVFLGPQAEVHPGAKIR